jgi:hypothetical protein
MANSGLGSQAGGAKETTWGTAVTPTKFWEYESESLKLNQNYYDGGGLVAGRTFAPQSRGKKTTRAATGDLAMTLPYKGGGFFFDQMVAGTITPVQQAASIAYLSTFNVGASLPTKSATLQVNKPQTSGGDIPFTYPGAVLVSAAFSLAVGGALMATFTWLCKDETTPTTTPAGASLATATYIASNDVWVHQDMTLTYGGSAVAGITGVNWTWTQPYADGRYFLDGSGTIAKPIPNGLATVTGNMTGEWYDSTFYAAFRSGAYASLVCTAAGPTAIASTFFPTFKNTFSAIQIRGESPTVDGADLVNLSVPFVAKDDGTNPPWKIESTSTDSVAW